MTRRAAQARPATRRALGGASGSSWWRSGAGTGRDRRRPGRRPGVAIEVPALRGAVVAARRTGTPGAGDRGDPARVRRLADAGGRLSRVSIVRVPFPEPRARARACHRVPRWPEARGLRAEASPRRRSSGSPSSIWSTGSGGAAGRPAVRGPDDHGSAAPTCTSTRLASDGTAASLEILDHVERRRRSSTSSPSPTTSGSMPPWPHGAMAGDVGCGSRSSSARRSRRWAATSSRCGSKRPVKPLRSLRSTIAAIHDQGGLAIPAHPLVPYPLCAQGFVLRRLLADEPRFRPDAIEAFNPTTLGRPWHARVVRFAEEHGLSTVGNSDAHCARGDRLGLLHVPRPDGRGAAGGDPERYDPPPRRLPRDDRTAGDLRAAAPQVRPGRTREPRRPDPPRRHRPRPRLPGRHHPGRARTRAGERGSR